MSIGQTQNSGVFDKKWDVGYTIAVGYESGVTRMKQREIESINKEAPASTVLRVSNSCGNLQGLLCV